MDDKSKLVNIKNLIKQETGRLSSLNVSRDLSLGGSKPKKVYTPNLNVTRNKNKPNFGAAKAQRGSSRRNTPRQSNRNAGNSSRFVQSSGIFSEGTANTKRPTLYSDKHASIREQETSSGMIKPKLGNTWNVDVKEEAVVVEDLLACDEESESDNDDEYEPIVLPLSANRDGFMNTFKVKKEVENKVKIEQIVPLTNGVDKQDIIFAEIMPKSSFTSNNKYDEDDVSVSLIKMPDSLPGKGFDDDNNPIDYTLRQMIEGKIGKILVRQSGKIDVFIGKTKYTLDTVEAAQFTEVQESFCKALILLSDGAHRSEPSVICRFPFWMSRLVRYSTELMCLPEKDKLKREPRLTSLGFINEKFVISPIWPDLLPLRKF